MSVNSEHEAFLHPNMMRPSLYEKFNDSDREIDQGRKKKKKTCKTYFRIFDEMIMKPLFIYNYQKVLQAKKNEFLMLILPDESEAESK